MKKRAMYIAAFCLFLMGAAACTETRKGIEKDIERLEKEYRELKGDDSSDSEKRRKEIKKDLEKLYKELKEEAKDLGEDAVEAGEDLLDDAKDFLKKNK